MMPAMLSSWFFALMMIFTGFVEYLSFWFFVKFIFVILMTVFHFWCGYFVGEFANNQRPKNGKFFRIINEIPTVFMIIIVTMVIIKPF